MNGWIKHFATGNSEYGKDEYIANKTVSWSQGRLSQMIGAELWHNQFRVARISAPGIYHQSDDFDVSLCHTVPNRVIRRLQFLIKPQHEFVVGELTNNSIDAYLTNGEVMHSEKQYSLFCGLHDCVDQWLTVEYDIKYDNIELYVSKDKL